MHKLQNVKDWDMNKIWHRYSPLFHIFGLIFLSGMAWAGVTSQAGRIDKLEIKQEAVAADITEIKVGQSRIEQKVDDLGAWMRARRNQ